MWRPEFILDKRSCHRVLFEYETFLSEMCMFRFIQVWDLSNTFYKLSKQLFLSLCYLLVLNDFFGLQIVSFPHKPLQLAEVSCKAHVSQDHLLANKKETQTLCSWVVISWMLIVDVQTEILHMSILFMGKLYQCGQHTLRSRWAF